MNHCKVKGALVGVFTWKEIAFVLTLDFLLGVLFGATWASFQ